jgi:N6-L-threonylcarbamoyladenine synthase
MIVLGIETSCDETAAAVVTAERAILANRVLSQAEAHRPYGGVVPEIAARAHVEHLDSLIRDALDQARVGIGGLDAIAATAGPGLLGGVMVGLVTGKAIAAVAGVPFLAVNHLEGHALSIRLVEDIAFPYLLLMVSGGHCQLLIVKDVGNYRRLGTTIDDAVGEAFDKTAKMLGLGYPGGPAVEAAARRGRADRFDLPRPLRGRPGCHFSFSGLKTAVWRVVESLARPLGQQDISDVAAAFQVAVGDVLVDRSARAAERFRSEHEDADRLVVAGGVAANGYLRDRLARLADDVGFTLHAPPAALCTDNGAMIAWAGLERLGRGMVDSLDAPPRARWPLDPDAAPAPGAGVKA